MHRIYMLSPHLHSFPVKPNGPLLASPPPVGRLIHRQPLFHSLPGVHCLLLCLHTCFASRFSWRSLTAIVPFLAGLPDSL